MRFSTITLFAVTSRLVTLVTANPVPNRKADGIAIPLTRHTSFHNNESIDLDAISSHGVLVHEKILRGLDNYEMNTGSMHPFAMKRSESGLERRGISSPLTALQFDMWTAEISIGTPPETFKVQIDTGTTDMWVLQTGCIGISRDRDLWDPDSSKFAKKQQPCRHTYADGTTVEGDLYTDNVTIAGLTADPQTFGSITLYTSEVQNNGHADGLLGLAFASGSEFGVDPLLVSLIRQKKLINPTFSFKLSSSGAEMYIGGANSMLYKGDITYIHITNPSFWQVSIGDVRVNGNKILANVPAVLDTGAHYIVGDWEQVSELYRHLGGTVRDHKGFGFYSLPCDSFPSLGFTFGSRTFEIPPEAFILGPVSEGSLDCFGAIIADSPSNYLGHWNVGVAFLQGVYSMFDYNTFQIGLADLA